MDYSDLSEDSPTLRRAKILTETARIEWRSLQRAFANGTAIQVADGLDLVEVAMVVAGDDRDALQCWLRGGEVGPVADAQALAWYEADATVWAVVIKPWVLVQSEDGRAG